MSEIGLNFWSKILNRC